MSNRLHKMSTSELMGRIGNCSPGTPAHSEYSAEYERRKHSVAVWGRFIAAAALVFGVLYYVGVLELIKRHIVH